MVGAPDSLLDRIYGAVGDPMRWPDALAGVAEHLGAQGGMLAQVGTTRASSAFVHTRLSPSHFEVFETQHLWNPWSEAMRRLPNDRVIVMGGVVERSILSRTAFYADVLEPQRTIDQLNVGLRCVGPKNGVGGIGFPFRVERSDDLDAAVGKLQLLVPHVRRALEASLQLGQVDRDRQLDVTLELLPNPAFLLDETGRIILANAAAEALLRAGDGLTTTDNGGLHLTAALPGEAATFRLSVARAIAVAGGRDAGLDEAIRLTRPSGDPPLVVFPVPLPAPAFPFWTLSQARVIVFVVDPAGEPAVDVETLKAALGLTATEARVALLVGSGHSAPRAAAKLGIAPTTVVTHLQRCFDKAGVRSQVQLARLLAAMPARRRPPD